MASVPEVATVLAALKDCTNVQVIEEAHSLIIYENTVDENRRLLLKATAQLCNNAKDEIRETALWALWWAANRGCADPNWVAGFLHAATLDELAKIRAGAWRLLKSSVIVRAGCGAARIHADQERRGVDRIKGPDDYQQALDEIHALQGRDNDQRERLYLTDLQAIVSEYHAYTDGQVATPPQMLRYLMARNQTTVNEVEKETGIGGLGEFIGGERLLAANQLRQLASYFGVLPEAFQNQEDPRDD